ncbi:MAG: 50S ribosome-binding GTPase [Planctomycetia bacterium]|nr:50S ribosome-binding GTPase [Planctomycetia bacterium]
MKLKTQWSLLALFAALPYILLGVAGAWWLYVSGWWLWWASFAALVMLVGWPMMRWLQKRTPFSVSADVEPGENWSPAGRTAWADVERIASSMRAEDIPLDRPEPILNLAREVIDVVARQFHAKSKRPAFEIPVPHLLHIVELVTHDLRETFSAHIPGSHILTINDLIKLKKVAMYAPTLYRVYRIAALVINPTTALARELGNIAQTKMLNASADETKRWALQFAIRKTGFYAIELYSGHLALRGVEFAPYKTERSQRAIADEEQRNGVLQDEPLRILVLGQVKAGKSSLVNAMFGETRAAIDVVPRTKDVEPYLLERDGVRKAIILDTAGYEDASRTAEALDQAREEIARCDLVLLVVSAVSAARDADRRLLDEVRELFQRNPDAELPPLVVVLSHIDQVRPFREWNPPYDLVRPQNAKAQQIRDAVEATAADLQVAVERVIPVCLTEGARYNIEEGLLPAIVASLGAAERLKYLRCLREFKDEQYWRGLREQAANTGRVLLSVGKHLLNEVLEPPRPN